VVLVVFDLDGTLVDSWRDLASSANALLEGCGARPLPAREVAAMVGDGAATLVERVCRAAGVEPPPDALARFLAIYDGHLLDSTRPYPGVPELLARLAARGPLAVLTNKPAAATRKILEGTGLARFFRTVVAGDGPLPRKPDPAGLRHLMAEAGAAPATTLLVGDAGVDVETARRAGTPFCLARYGFGLDGGGIALGGDAWVADTPGEIEAVVAHLAARHRAG
jgi:phosphoglycolate phosphatase